MTSKSKIPKDLGIKIGTPDEILWTDFKKKIASGQEVLEKEIKINKAILELCETKLKDCKTEKKPPIGVG